MMEAIWNVLDLGQKIGIVMLLSIIPIGIYLHIENNGGLVYINDLKRKFKGVMK